MLLQSLRWCKGLLLMQFNRISRDSNCNPLQYIRCTIISLIEIAIIFDDDVVHEIGCKQAVSHSANEFTLNAFVINRLIPDNLMCPQLKAIGN